MDTAVADVSLLIITCLYHPYFCDYSRPLCQIVGARGSGLQGRGWTVRGQQELLWSQWWPNLYLCESVHVIGNDV